MPRSSPNLIGMETRPSLRWLWPGPGGTDHCAARHALARQAARAGQEKMVRWLVEHGAKVDEKNEWGDAAVNEVRAHPVRAFSPSRDRDVLSCRRLRPWATFPSCGFWPRRARTSRASTRTTSVEVSGRRFPSSHRPALCFHSLRLLQLSPASHRSQCASALCRAPPLGGSTRQAERGASAVHCPFPSDAPIAPPSFAPSAARASLVPALSCPCVLVIVATRFW